MKKKLFFVVIVAIMLMTLMSLSVFAASESEPNNKKDQATSISVNTNVTGSISDSNDADWYKFTLSQAGAISVSFSHTTLSSTNYYWDIYIYQTDGTTGVEGSSSVYWSVPGNENITTCEIGLSIGTYYIKIAPYSSSRRDSSTYTIKVNFKQSSNYEKEVNGKTTTATQISTNQDYYGAINSGNDVDWYKFTTQSDGKISISFSHDILASTNTYWEVYVYNIDGVTGIEGSSSVYWSVPGNENITTCEIGVPAGTYYIKIEPYSSSRRDSSTYTMKVNYQSSNQYEKEINGKASTANTIQVNADYYGAIISGSDADWFKFTTPSEGKITVSFAHDVISSTNTYWKMYMYRDDGVTGIEGSSSVYWSIPGNQNMTTSEIGLPAGTYYIKIVPYSSSRRDGSTYTLNVNFEQTDKYEKEINGKPSSANKIGLMSNYYGAINSSSDVDWYKFDINNKSEITVVFSHGKNDSSNTYWEIYSYKSDGVTILKDYCKVSGNQDVNYVLGELSPGTYYIKIVPYSSSRVDSTTYIVNLNEKHDCVGSWQVVSSATCDKNGSKELICNICGRVMETEPIPAAGHSLANWTVDIASTCTNVGQRHAVCVACGKTVTETIEMLDHEFGQAIMEIEPTCHSSGKETKVCKNCGYSESNVVEPLAHIFSEWYTTKEATCNENGTEERKCSLCGDTETRIVTQLTHEYGDWKVVSGSKLIPPIVKEKTCIHCGDIQTTQDWSYIWITILVVFALIGVLIGIINYARAFKNR